MSTGSACSSGSLEPSHVLRAMGLPSPRARNSLRFSLGAGHDRRGNRLRRRRPAGARRASCAASAARPRRCASHARRRRDVGRRGFVGRREPARRGRPRGHRPVDAALRPARVAARRSDRAAASTTCTTRGASPPRSAFPHYIVNFEERVPARRSCENFVDEYAAGRTPIPCVHCNADLKFATLVERAAGLRRRGGRRPATTRASTFDEDARRYRLLRSVDRDKDQSYFLFSLTQDQLAHALFPVGHLTKPEVRAHAGAARPRRRRQARQPRDLLRPGRRRRRLRRAAARRRATDAARSSTPAARSSAGTAACTLTVGQRKGLGLVDRHAAVRAASSSRPSARRRRPARGARRPRRSTASRVNWIAGAPPAGAASRHRAHPPPPHATRRRPSRRDGDDRAHVDVRRAADGHHARPGGGVLRRRGSGRRRVD